jgi:hypothetical protein
MASVVKQSNGKSRVEQIRAEKGLVALSFAGGLHQFKHSH